MTTSGHVVIELAGRSEPALIHNRKDQFYAARRKHSAELFFGEFTTVETG